ncbi:TlpA family protein disulfide reductase [Aequorivita echinoideorum]|uniref:TlpA family protein disulfide reductase n=1 Tax=Aequorivita echinoideorum TaxID=1549647 RepID=A0ABS5S0I9_9FLAO|nr:TlpA disulfide reductase family protein [Aequorivita echinoideorum]MBT0606733.1 TlpA family protein disulfide reductase [Aequorivita echinoideorum]
MDNKKKKTWIQYGIFAVVVIFLYATGLHTEVIGFAQRGLLATGLMNPDVEEIAENTSVENRIVAKADYNLDLIDKNGKIVPLKKFKGKVIFLNFWATWCPPCVAEMPSIEKLYRNMGNEVEFVMLSFDNNFETAKEYVKRKEYDLPIYSAASTIPDMYDSNALPTTYVIDANGNLALTHQGMADYNNEEFKEFLKNLK